ncbi:Elongation factor G-2 [Durusdinium trenchii]|uniref:Chloroplastic n=1 Tax=Durusdinium trenchii TaxID=1381693 RepID=A0ABP0KVR4_9DINO
MERVRSWLSVEHVQKTVTHNVTDLSMEDAMQDPESAIFDITASRDAARLGFRGSLFLCTLLAFSVSALSVGLWSEMGCGEPCLMFLQRHKMLALLCAGISLLLLLALYLLDFFMPPHMPGEYCSLYHGDRLLGRGILAFALVGLLGAAFFLADTFPTAPLVLTIFLSPTLLIGVRQATKPKPRFVLGTGSKDASLQERLRMLKMVTGEEKEQCCFYKAATFGFLLTAFTCIALWIPWAATTQVQLTEGMDATEREISFVRWSTPLIVGISNIIFASFTGLRVALDQAYAGTDDNRAQIILSSRSHMNRELMDHRIAQLRARLAAETPGSQVQKTRDRAQQYLIQHTAHMRQLSNIVKTVGCGFIALLGALYIAFQLTAADSHIADMVQCFLGAFFLTFVAFIFVSFNRLWQAMSTWLQDLPLWKSAVGLCSSTWARAALLCLVMPLVPLMVLLSSLNQAVRCARGFKDRRCLTERVHTTFAQAAQWEWVSLASWAYIMATIMMLYKVIPLFINVLLAWLNSVVAHLPFAGILGFTFGAGMVLFMLPPVPGPPIYLFGGLVISEHCPYGFWWGCVICIILCMALKLSACAIQQKVIGELLGNRQSIRHACGVHRPFMRAIEQVLRRPGMSFGKCMILCGGPDWPTSVLAGILRLSLVQCTIGTLPVILSLIPLALTGSFYLRRDESEVWARAGNLMFSLTALVSVTFWTGMGWAIQDTFDKYNEQLTAPKVEFVELDWLDHCEDRIRDKCQLRFKDLPAWVSFFHFTGAFLMVAVAQFFFWRADSCFGKFKVTDDIAELHWWPWTGDPGSAMIKMPGLAGVILVAVAFVFLMVSRLWRSRHNAKATKLMRAELALEEEAWKARRREEAQNWSPQSASASPVKKQRKYPGSSACITLSACWSSGMRPPSPWATSTPLCRVSLPLPWKEPP